jgi:hypothetical protein
MTKKIIFLLCIGFLFSCKKDNPDPETSLIGKWKLIEVLNDPGDGSGTFQGVQSNKTIEFHSNGNVTSNGSICNNSTESNTSTSGTYSLSNSTIDSPDCHNDSILTINFEHKNSILIINFPCIEPCKGKFEKM